MRVIAIRDCLILANPSQLLATTALRWSTIPNRLEQVWALSVDETAFLAATPVFGTRSRPASSR